jgi:hypothetical protein
LLLLLIIIIFIYILRHLFGKWIKNQ